MALTEEDLDRLEKIALAAAKVAPGSWDRDTEKNEGEYGGGPDSREGFSSWFAHDEKGRRLFDAYNSDFICVEEEWDEDGGSATDVDGGKLIKFATYFDPPTVLALLNASRSSQSAEVERLKAALAELVALFDQFRASDCNSTNALDILVRYPVWERARQALEVNNDGNDG